MGIWGPDTRSICGLEWSCEGEGRGLEAAGVQATSAWWSTDGGKGEAFLPAGRQHPAMAASFQRAHEARSTRWRQEAVLLVAAGGSFARPVGHQAAAGEHRGGGGIPLCPRDANERDGAPRSSCGSLLCLC
jgi:hypothetical protein